MYRESKCECLILKVVMDLRSLWREFFLRLPDESSMFRVCHYNRHGCSINRSVSISLNVSLRGLVEIDAGSSMAQNSVINGMPVGVQNIRNLTIAPNVVMVAFDHGYSNR